MKKTLEFAEITMEDFDGSLTFYVKREMNGQYVFFVQNVPAACTEFLACYRMPLNKDPNFYIEALKYRMLLDIEGQEEAEGFMVQLPESMINEVIERIDA